jgi:hypothetical protein
MLQLLVFDDDARVVALELGFKSLLGSLDRRARGRASVAPFEISILNRLSEKPEWLCAACSYEIKKPARRSAASHRNMRTIVHLKLAGLDLKRIGDLLVVGVLLAELVDERPGPEEVVVHDSRRSRRPWSPLQEDLAGQRHTTLGSGAHSALLRTPAEHTSRSPCRHSRYAPPSLCF